MFRQATNCRTQHGGSDCYCGHEMVISADLSDQTQCCRTYLAWLLLGIEQASDSADSSVLRTSDTDDELLPSSLLFGKSARYSYQAEGVQAD